MSILIRGMEMPKSCFDCPFVDFEYGDCLVDENGHGDPNEPENCPLVPVPPHGDLIDRKTAYESILNGMVMTGYQSRALDCVSEFYAPTIIPASEEGE